MTYKNILTLLFLLPFMGGCTSLWQNIAPSETEHNVSSSLVDYLYPHQPKQNTQATHANSYPAAKPNKPAITSTISSNDSGTNNSNNNINNNGSTAFWTNDLVPEGVQTKAPTQQTITTTTTNIVNAKKSPNLTLPLQVGLAFIPSKGTIPGLSEARKVLLLESVKQKFEQYSFISHVQIIPEMYFKSGKGLEHVAQIGRRFHLDTIALVSYDQVVHTNDNKLSLLYLTIVGAYVVNGSDFDTQTFVDTAVFDVKSKHLLFRAPGVDNATTSTTLVGSVQKKRNTRYQSFEAAFSNMVSNLETEINLFKQRAFKDAQHLPHQPGNEMGAGSLYLPVLVLLLGTILARAQFASRIKQPPITDYIEAGDRCVCANSSIETT